MPSVAILMGLELITLSEGRKTILYYLYVGPKIRHKLVYETETDSQRKQTLERGEGVGEGEIRSLGLANTSYYI